MLEIWVKWQAFWDMAVVVLFVDVDVRKAVHCHWAAVAEELLGSQGLEAVVLKKGIR